MNTSAPTPGTILFRLLVLYGREQARVPRQGAIRNTDPRLFQIITLRTIERRLWLNPNRTITKLLGGILARYQEIYGIELYSYVCINNHIHLMVRAPQQNLHLFCQNVDREISRRINRLYDRSGPLWSNNYSAAQIKDCDTDRLRVLAYINANPTRHGLVRNPFEWTGLSSIQHIFSGEDREFSFVHYSKLVDGKPLITHHKLCLSVLPELRSLTKGERRKKLRALMNQTTARLVSLREASEKTFLGMKQVIQRAPGYRPVSQTKRSGTLAQTGKPRRSLVEEERKRRAIYQVASLLWRSGELTTTFPEFCFRPPLHQRPRIAPFREMTAEQLTYLTTKDADLS